jgi:hypothetical protein
VQLGVAALIASAAALLASREALLRVVVRAVIHSNPSEAFMLGFVLAVWPLSNIGLTTHHLPGSTALRRMLAVSLSLGLTLMVVEPDFGVLIGAQRRAGGAGGAGGEREGPAWAPWCLVGCVCLMLCLCASVVRQQGLLRSLAAGGGGGLLGCYFDVTFMPASPVLAAAAAGTTALAAVFVASLLVLGQRSGVARGGGLGMQLVRCGWLRLGFGVKGVGCRV